MKYRVTLEGDEHEVEVERTDTGWRVRLQDVEWREIQGALRKGELSLGSRRIGTHIQGDQVALQVAGTSLVAQVVDPRKARADLGGGGAEGELRTPMPGVVVRIPVAEGQHVEEGQVLVVVEAMKMENEFKAPVAGTVGSIPVQVGQALDSNALLAVVEPE